MQGLRMGGVSRVVMLFCSVVAGVGGGVIKPCTGEGWTVHGKKCFKLLGPQEKPASEALTACQGEKLGRDDGNPRLVQIMDKDEQTFILELIKEGTTPIWLGAGRQPGDGANFTWSTGDRPSMRYSNWAEGSPNGDEGSGCVEMGVTGSWTNVPCDKGSRVVCEKWPLWTTSDMIDAITTLQAGQEEEVAKKLREQGGRSMATTPTEQESSANVVSPTKTGDAATPSLETSSNTQSSADRIQAPSEKGSSPEISVSANDTPPTSTAGPTKEEEEPGHTPTSPNSSTPTRQQEDEPLTKSISESSSPNPSPNTNLIPGGGELVQDNPNSGGTPISPLVPTVPSDKSSPISASPNNKTKEGGSGGASTNKKGGSGSGRKGSDASTVDYEPQFSPGDWTDSY